MTLNRLWQSGLVQSEDRGKITGQGNKSRYKVFFSPELFNSPATLTVSSIELLNNNVAQEPLQEPVQELKSSLTEDSRVIEQTRHETSTSDKILKVGAHVAHASAGAKVL